MANELQLFKVETRGCGDFHVVSTDFNAAAKAVSDELNAQDYGYSNDRQVTRVEFLMRQRWMQDGRRALYGDSDENHLMIDGSTSMEAEERKIAKKMAKLDEKEAELMALKGSLMDNYNQAKTELEARIERELAMKPADHREFSDIVSVLAKHYIESGDTDKGEWIGAATDTSKGRYSIDIDIRPVEGKNVKQGMQTIRPKKTEFDAVFYAATMLRGIADSKQPIEYCEDSKKEAEKMAKTLDGFIGRMFIASKQD